ncbi:WEB family protein At2g38370-like [Sesamum indicum]|uniref:WEB family protein At2g38370-like n=1 Tax=Sesamum indicum TaxID=4182 RepID=A0A6I9TUA3_SESIN|nr:WEB family protein At2g38370-like [Sesamum indicum]
MAETLESSAVTETKKVINPRAEIDTSPPFESVKEAVDRFGGSGPWIPHYLLRVAAAGNHETDLEKLEEQAVQLERDLIMKEQQTLNVLKELEAAKKFVEGLKVNLIPESSSGIASPELKLDNRMTFPDENSTEGLSLCPVLSPGLMFMELNQAKLNLNKTSGNLAAIQASVESLNKKMRRDKLLLERGSNMQIPNSEGVLSLEQNHHISRTKPNVDRKIEIRDAPNISMSMCKELRQVNFEAEQFKKMTEASRYEVIKAMTEIERTKNSIRMAEMRLSAAKKMEEAAKAVEAIALAERNAFLNCEKSSDVFLDKPNGITLTVEEYRALTLKAQQAEDLCKTKFIDTNAVRLTSEAHQLEEPILEKFEEIAKENTRSREVDLFDEEGPHRKNVIAEDHVPVQQSDNNSTKFKFRNSHPGHTNPHVLNENESYAAKERPVPGFRTTTSIGDILSRKLILQDDVMVGRHVETHSEKQHISLSQMLQEQSRLILHPRKPTADVNVEKQYFVQQRKKFGFIQVPLPTKQSKKKTHPLNMR